ncbi:hypothetical protein KDAU_61040 [Dictyobacter aurantiacus]|uniref:Uncharacterized protein n=1 Tax=Dictyobacter aurantiacus TaxID=1936993 RepID=A0A401ZPH6_9CHLR|nr:hypothetical protein KDAU_61040 [Dictyobacter aurantiacus]
MAEVRERQDSHHPAENYLQADYREDTAAPAGYTVPTNNSGYRAMNSAALIDRGRRHSWVVVAQVYYHSLLEALALRKRLAATVPADYHSMLALLNHMKGTH